MMLDCLNSVVLACITVYILQFAGEIAMEVLIFPLVSLFTHEMIVCEIVKRKIVGLSLLYLIHSDSVEANSNADSKHD
jgi:hypothetical protein